jgi:hypothetical protein
MGTTLSEVSRRALLTVFALLASGWIVVTGIAVVANLAATENRHVTGPSVVCAVAAALLVMALYGKTCGLRIHPVKGVRSRQFLGGTERVAWPDLARAEVRPAQPDRWSYGVPPGFCYIWLVRADGTALRTTIRSWADYDWRRHTRAPEEGMSDRDLELVVRHIESTRRYALTTTGTS